MQWTYNQKTGALAGPDGRIVATGYSGFGPGKNNPAQEAVKSVGPIPRGLWAIGEPHDSDAVGPFALPLTPVGHDAHGRSAFLMHGDSKSRPGEASHGCIIMPPFARQAVDRSPVKSLEVV